MKTRHRIELGPSYTGKSQNRYRAEISLAEERIEPEKTAGRTYCIMAVPQKMDEPAVQRNIDGKSSADFRDRTEEHVPKKSGLNVRHIAKAIAGLLFAAVVISSPLWLTGEKLLPIMKQLSAASAAVQLPEQTVVSASEPQVSTSETAQSTVASTQTTTTTATTVPSQINTDGLKKVSEKQVGNSGTKVGSIYVKNSTGYNPDFKNIMAQEADCRIKLNAGYQVLIVHTHTTEGYAQRADGLYDPDYSPRTTDSSMSVVAVGDVLTQQLEKAGIRTLHAVEVHDHPKYNGSYDRANSTISRYLEQYPSIEMVLDVHRDAITNDDGTKLKPTVEVDGRKAAQVMIISGCDAGGKLYFPEWKKNLCMALQIQQAAQDSSPGLMRPLSFAPYRYNMHMTPNSLLLEFGTDVNTLEEALYSAELLGGAIAEVLLEYNVSK